MAKESFADEAEFALHLAYHRQLKEKKFFGVVEMTYQAGELKHVREVAAHPIGAVVSSLIDKVPEKYRAHLKERYREHKAFVSE
jgi:hypothetical protein